MELFNQWLEQWEPLWLFLVLYFEAMVCVLTYYYVRREWLSSDSLDKKFDKVISKYIRRLEENHYDLIRKVLRKSKRKKRK